jgi:hypothetical protein
MSRIAKEIRMRFLRPSSVNSTGMDYSAAVASAVAWLGNRYILATPVPRLTDAERSIARSDGHTSDEAALSPEEEFWPGLHCGP